MSAIPNTTNSTPTASSDTDTQLHAESSSTSQQHVEEKAKRLAPLQRGRIGVVKAKYNEIRALSRRGEEIVDELVEKYSTEVDEFIASFESLLAGNKTISDTVLERAAMKLPIIMYRMGDMIDQAAMESEVAKAASKSVYAQAYLDAVGTIPEREAQAELTSADEAVIVDLSKRVYSRLRHKLDYADKLFDGVRKVMSKRDTEKNVFRKEQSN